MINIYIDTSGSMTEMGKDSAILYIAKSIQDYCKFHSIETQFLYLNGEKIDKLEDIKYSNDRSLNIKNILEKNILLSDSLFEGKENIFDVSISIGIDADLSRLNKISKKVFSNDNILTALEYFIFHYQMDSINITEEDEDEW